ncbi:MAG: hypothetical protein AAFV59_07485 [Pseudomonadota bacterium]
MADDLKEGPPNPYDASEVVMTDELRRSMNNAKEAAIPRPFDLTKLYASEAEGVEDERSTVGLALKMKVHEALKQIAEEHGYAKSQFIRRCLFLGMQNPALLKAVDEQDDHYKSLLQHNGWN